MYFSSNTFRAFLPISIHASSCSIIHFILFARSCGLPGSNSRPVLPFSTNSANDPRFEAITGLPQAKASPTVIGNPSYHTEGMTRNRAFLSNSIQSSRLFLPRNSTHLSTPNIFTLSVRSCPKGPSPMTLSFKSQESSGDSALKASITT
ncbi:hypothetical protein ES703_65701 [subsurface metagenome]